uniref:Nucleolus and neural progenitor protein-like N-terminal domain-containing protein n=1 Tax=Anopheles coluzzii TaxID=1518534 RepID=A0A8W7P1E1_ANOCL
MDFHSFPSVSEYIPQTVYMLVRSNLEYLVVRMQGLCKLLMSVVYLTKRTEAARLHVKQMQLLYPTYVIFLGLMELILIVELIPISESILIMVLEQIGIPRSIPDLEEYYQLQPQKPIVLSISCSSGVLPSSSDSGTMGFICGARRDDDDGIGSYDLWRKMKRRNETILLTK